MHPVIFPRFQDDFACFFTRIDVGNLARFLIGPESRWITGVAINVDGGHALRRGPDFGQFVEPAIGKNVMAGDRPSD